MIGAPQGLRELTELPRSRGNTEAHKMFIFAFQDLGRSEISAELDSALIPTTFFPDSTDGVVWEQVIYPQPTEVIEWYSVDPLPVFQDGAVIQARLTVEEYAGPGALDLSGQLRIQVCDADYCYPPERVPVTAAITVIQ